MYVTYLKNCVAVNILSTKLHFEGDGPLTANILKCLHLISAIHNDF